MAPLRYFFKIPRRVNLAGGRWSAARAANTMPADDANVVAEGQRLRLGTYNVLGLTGFSAAVRDLEIDASADG